MDYSVLPEAELEQQMTMNFVRRCCSKPTYLKSFNFSGDNMKIDIFWKSNDFSSSDVVMRRAWYHSHRKKQVISFADYDW